MPSTSRGIVHDRTFLRIYADAREMDVVGPVEPTYYSLLGYRNILNIAVFKEVHRLTTVNDLDPHCQPVFMCLGNGVR